MAETTFLKFREDQKSPTLEIGQGEYRRLFKADEQPFEVADAEEAQALRNTGYFVDADAPKSKAQSPKPKVEGKIGGAPAESVSGEQ